MNDNILGERLEECRKKAGLTQQQLASELCVQRQIISYYENGSRKPDVDMLKTLAKRFNVTTDYLLGVYSIDVTELEKEHIACEFLDMKSSDLYAMKVVAKLISEDKKIGELMKWFAKYANETQT